MPIRTETYDGVPGGMNLAFPEQEIPDTECRYLQDGLVDYPGIIRRRGPVEPLANVVTFSNKVSGIAQTLDPRGTHRTAVLHGTSSSAFLGVVSADGASKVDLTWHGQLPSAPPSSPYYIVDVKPALTGGTWIGTSSIYENGGTQALGLWRGGNKANYSAGTITVTRGSKTVTGSGTAWTTNLTPGMFLFATADDPALETYFGVIYEVVSDTELKLGSESPYAATGKSYTAKSIRGLCPRVVTGYLTTATSSTTVTGSKTKFKDHKLDSGTWTIYRASDMGYIGKVSAVTNNTSLTLTANAALALSNERYVALKADGNYDLDTIANERKVGFLTAIYAERQWYANLGQTFDLTTRVWFSDPSDPEALDLAAFDGDFISIGATSGVNSPIRALVPAYNALLVFKENEVFAIYGSTPSQFEVKKIHDDGVLSGMSVMPYMGGVLWAGRDGINYYDGIAVDNLVQFKLGDYYKNTVRSFDPSEYRMWSMIVRDHYFIHMERVDPQVAVIKGTTSSTPTQYTIVINLPTRAVSIFTNLHIRGAIKLPADTGEQSWYVINSSTTGYICDSAALFDKTGNDTVAADGGTAGPDFYFESKKYKAGDSLRKKLFKQVAINYLAQGDALKLDTVIGMNNTGKTSTSEFAATVYTWDSLRLAFATWTDLKNTHPTWNSVMNAVFKPKRIKFLKRTQLLSFRIWQKSSNVTRVTLGPFQIGFKYQRPGRV